MKLSLERKMLFRLIGFVLLFVILFNVDWHSLYMSFDKLRFEYLLLVIPLIVITAWVKSGRWLYIVRKLGVHLSVWHAFIYYTISFFWGTVTPGKIGEFAKVIYMKENGATTSKAVLSVIIDRILDLVFLGVLAVVGMMVVLDLVYLWRLVLGGAVIIMVSVILLMHNGYALHSMKRFIIIFIPNKYKVEVHDCVDAMQRDLSLFSFGSIGILLILLILSWVCHAAPLCVLGWGLGLQVTLPVLVMSIFLSSAISMLPISVGGIGTRDAFLIFYLSRYGISMEDALLFSFMFVYVYIIALVIGYLSYLWKPRLNLQQSVTGN